MADINSRLAVVTEEEIVQMLNFLECVVLFSSISGIVAFMLSYYELCFRNFLATNCFTSI